MLKKVLRIAVLSLTGLVALYLIMSLIFPTKVAVIFSKNTTLSKIDQEAIASILKSKYKNKLFLLPEETIALGEAFAPKNPEKKQYQLLVRGSVQSPFPDEIGQKHWPFVVYKTEKGVWELADHLCCALGMDWY